MENKRSFGITMFGWLCILFSALLLILNCFGLYKTIPIMAMVSLLALETQVINSIYIGFTIVILLILAFFLSIYFFTGIGLLRLKSWARYLIIVLALTHIISISANVLFFGWRYVSQPGTIFKILWVIAIFFFILWYFTRSEIKSRFHTEGEKFRLRSRYGIVICLVVFFTLLVPVGYLGYKAYTALRYKQPFYNTRFKITNLKEIDDNDFSNTHRRINIFDMSFLVPKDFVIVSFLKGPKKTFTWFLSEPAPSRGVRSRIVVSNDIKMIEMLPKDLYKTAHYENTFDFERFFYSDNWNPIVTIYRAAVLGEKNFTMEEIYSSNFKGFIRYLYHEKAKPGSYICSFYSKDNLSSREFQIIGLERSGVLDVISSFRFLKQQKTQAREYYAKGQEELNSGEVMAAQIKFANAYYLAPEKPEYGYMLAKTTFMLLKNRSFSVVEQMLKDVLKSNPDYAEAKDLLEKIDKLKSSVSLPEINKQFK